MTEEHYRDSPRYLNSSRSSAGFHLYLGLGWDFVANDALFPPIWDKLLGVILSHQSYPATVQSYTVVQFIL